MKVSIIIPVYNGEEYIDKCMDHIINQKFDDFEVIIINDGSTDNSYKIIKKYQKKYKYISVINQTNSGQAVARNKAIDMAKGEYITFVDIDDFIDTTFLQEMVSLADEKKVDVVYCDYYEYYNPTNLKHMKNDKHPLLSAPAPWGKIFKRSFFNKTKLRFLEGKLFEDIVIIPVLMVLGKSYYLPLPLYYYNGSNESSIRRKTYSRKLEDVFDAIDETIYNFKKYKLYNKYKEEIEFIYLDSFLKGSVMRFADFKEGTKFIPKVREKILNYFPDILNNKYYLNSTKKEQLIYKICLKMNPNVFGVIKRTRKKVKRCKRY